jgi:hypothetical protein
MGLYEMNDEFVQNISMYCSRRPNLYVDILSMKDRKALSQFFRMEQARYPISDWKEN